MATSSNNSRLSALQSAFLKAFFARSRDFFLTGGGALAEFYLHHRTTEDLDLFATPDVDIETGARVLRAAASDVDATAERLQASVDFSRFAVRRGEEVTLVDLVIDRVPQLEPKTERAGILVDSLSEIGANKICALLGRTEPRDLVDLSAILERMTLAEILLLAQRKDGAADPATLAWVLDRYRIRPGMALPAGVAPAYLEEFRAELVRQLLVLAFPKQ